MHTKTKGENGMEEIRWQNMREILARKCNFADCFYSRADAGHRGNEAGDHELTTADESPADARSRNATLQSA